MARQELDQLTEEEQQIIELLKSKSRAEQKQILFELERKFKNGNL